ncbi:hypothetical protein [Couchioplanes caeruleus]|uniref:Uncharacterized protein n=2 Tax=Couchioplanes caeruleus TaxID=56438 RepID=A0A1K0GSJ3_9ACTN|nr:hypothetical protein [Couchioplanes caeruleus]OJF12259.1 hypothetical protein BG844_21705 [Couchioplanes caeruleus subsp. caeruleus]ROP33267.1 hypothetical protein EDD30_6237 [Couchioplanes caeruleus]
MSVFRGSNSSTAWPEGADPYPDGPTERLGPEPDRSSAPPSSPPQPRRGAVFAVLLAMLALLAAAAAVLLAWRALERADQAFARPLPAASGASPAVAGAYGEEILRIQAGCTGVTFLDLDEPRVNAAGPVSDLRYDSRCGDEAPQLTLAPGAVGGSDVGAADVDGPGCARAVRTSPLGGGLIVPVRTGLVMCVLTGTGTPPTAGVRLVRVKVDQVSADGTVSLRATAWPAG